MASVRLENKSARILLIGLGGAESISVPPAEGGIVVTFSSGAEQERFARAVATPAVQEWIDSGELVLTDPERRSPAEPVEPAEPDEDEEED